MELRQIRYFLAVAQELHFGKAAKDLYMTEQPVSFQIKKLESELGFQLFDRTTRSVSLTPAGEAFRRSALRGIEAFETGVELADKIAKGEAGRFCVVYHSATVPGVFPYCVMRFRKRYPDVQLALREQNIFNVEQATLDILAGKVDVGFLLLYEELLSGLDYEVVHESPTVVALPKNHPLARREALSLTDLKDIPILSYSSSPEPGPHNFILKICRDAGFEPQIVQEAQTAMSLIGLVAAGLGVTFALADFGDLMADHVVYRTLEKPKIMNQTVVAWNPERRTAHVDNLLEIARSVAGREFRPSRTTHT